MNFQTSGCKNDHSLIIWLTSKANSIYFSPWPNLTSLCFLTLIFLCGSDGKEFTCNAGDPGLISGSGRSPGEGNGQPLQHSCLKKSHGQRSLAGYSPWSCKESGSTEQLTLSLFNKTVSSEGPGHF